MGAGGDGERPGLTVETANRAAVECEYAVRGEVVVAAGALEAKLAEPGNALPFEKVVRCNIGNPQALGQKPVTFFRQVLALCDWPALLDMPEAAAIFPKDVRARAQAIMDGIPGGTGPYSHSQGAPFLRGEVARAIERRDGGHRCDPNNLYLTDGASPAVQAVMRASLRGPEDAILVPVPQYPLYSATLRLCNGSMVPYYLDEANDWGLSVDELARAVGEARAAGKTVRGLAVINPGNPTGQCLSEENMRDVVKFCEREGIALMADEVYQQNVYAEGKAFSSFKKVVCDLGSGVELFSFHSISKGFYGECGRRGGYMEAHNVSESFRALLYKLSSVNLCSNLNGQICMSLVMNPPQEGEESYPLFVEEREAILSSLKRRSRKLVAALNELEGVTCNEAQGAMYAFPQIRLPAKALAAAEAEGRKGDQFYSMELLKATGVVVVAGTGFKQVEGTLHFRTTFLPSEKDIDSVVDRVTQFHKTFMEKYRD